MHFQSGFGFVFFLGFVAGGIAVLGLIVPMYKQEIKCLQERLIHEEGRTEKIVSYVSSFRS